MMYQNKKRITVSALICAVFCLNACTMLGPEYEEPSVEWARDWQPDLYGQLGDPQRDSQLDLSFWWQLFDDPVLNSLIDTAKQQNPSLRIAGLRILQSRAQLGIAGSNRYPQVQQASGAVDYLDSIQSGSNAPNDQSLTSYQTGLGLGWELDFWGRFKRGIESADAAFFASITNQQDVQVLLSATIADLYFGFRATLLQIDIARKNAGIQKRSFEITEQRFSSGQDSELDLQQAKTQYLATLATIPGLEISLIQTRNALGALLGRAPGDLPELSTVATHLPALELMVIADVPVTLLMRRPDIRTAAWQVAARSAQIGIAEADYYPAISLTGSVGWSGNDQSGSSDITRLLGGSSFTWNIFDHGRIANNVRLQDARLQEAIEFFQDSVLQAAREIDDAAISVVKTHEQRAILVESVRSAERSLELANKLFIEGYADFQRVLDSQRSVFAQLTNELTNQSIHISSVISLYKAFGGGWTGMQVEQLIPEETRKKMADRSDWGTLLTDPLPALTPHSGSETLP